VLSSFIIDYNICFIIADVCDIALSDKEIADDFKVGNQKP
jgi:hypothetical protein